jgi:ABC-type antimicrobial peptide transport system permease subunit
VNQAFARRYFPGGIVLGQRVGQSRLVEIVGVVGDIKYQTLRSEIEPMIFTPVSSGYLILRTASNPMSLAGAVRQTIEEAAPGFRVGRMSSLSEQIDQQLFNERMLARLSAAFGILALALAAIGVYGVVAYSVARRTGEIAIRVSLGALPRDVARLVLFEGLLPVLVGMLAGLLAAYGLTRLVTTFLYGVTPLDTLTFGTATIVLLGAAVLACCIPLRRALRVEPMAALRCE